MTILAYLIALLSQSPTFSRVTLSMGGPALGPVAIFNYSQNARPGDVIYVQGQNLGASPVAKLSSSLAGAQTTLTTVNTTGTGSFAAAVPSGWTGAMFLQVSNGASNSSVVKLNGATPWNLDALQIVPSGAFRVLGRNLMLSGYTPAVTVSGLAATVNTGASTENMLVVTAPAGLTATSAAVITVDNGNGTGPATLQRTIVAVAGSGDPFSLGVGWGAGFTFSGAVTTVSTPCNGTTDDTSAIQAGINTAATSGGVVQLPSGTCRLAGSLAMASRVVLQGMGKTATTLNYEANYPIGAQGLDLVGIRNLTLNNSASTLEGVIWQNNTRSFMQSVKIAENVSRQLFITGNNNFIVDHVDLVQTGSVSQQNPYLFSNCGGFVFSNNTSVIVDGSPTFQGVHDALFLNNHFTRNAVNQNESTVIATHQFVMDFMFRTAIIGNTFDVSNGPITNTARNDGETLLTEDGGSNRTENWGTATGATATTLTDSGNTINVNPFGTGLPENYGIAIVAGAGAGQTREVTGYSAGTVTVDHAWDVTPDTTSKYSTFVWGIEKTLIEGNTLTGNPRGIWLYQSSAREVDIGGNAITQGGGIFLRSFEDSTVKQFDPQYNIRVANNTVGNSSSTWMSYADAVFINKDTTNFGTAMTGIDLHGNALTANSPNQTSSTEDVVSTEGFVATMRSQTTGGVLGSIPMLLGSVFQGNSCPSCSQAFTVGSGAYGTVLSGNTPNTYLDFQTLGSGQPASVGTVTIASAGYTVSTLPGTVSSLTGTVSSITGSAAYTVSNLPGTVSTLNGTVSTVH